MLTTELLCRRLPYRHLASLDRPLHPSRLHVRTPPNTGTGQMLSDVVARDNFSSPMLVVP